MRPAAGVSCGSWVWDGRRGAGYQDDLAVSRAADLGRRAVCEPFERLDTMVHERGCLAIGGQVVDAMVSRGPRLNAEEKAVVHGDGKP